MASRLSHDKITEMFAVYSERACIEDVARRCSISHVTAERYREKERWDQRLAAIRSQVQQRADHDLAHAMAESLEIVRVYKAKIADALNGKTVHADDVNASELERLMKLEAYLLGGVESRNEIITSFEGWSDEQLEAYANGVSSGKLPDQTRSGAA